MALEMLSTANIRGKSGRNQICKFLKWRGSKRIEGKLVEVESYSITKEVGQKEKANERGTIE